MLLPIETFTFPEAYALVGTMATDSTSAIAMATRTIFEAVSYTHLELKKGLAYALRKRTRDLSPYEASALRALREDPSYSTLMTCLLYTSRCV